MSDEAEKRRPGIVELNESQRRVVAAALTVVGLAAILVVGQWFLTGVAHFLTAFSGVLMPLATAGILALVLQPYYQCIHRHVRGKSVTAVAIVFLTILLPVLILSIAFGGMLVDQIKDLMAALPALLGKLMAWLQRTWPHLQPMLEEQQGALFAGAKQAALTALAAGISLFAAISGMLGWFVLPIYLAFFLMAPPVKVADAEKLLPFLKEGTRKDVVFLAEQFVEIMVSFFRGQLLIGLMQGVLFAIGFSLVGLRFGFILGIVLGFLNIVPYLGSIVGLSVCLPLALFQAGGGWGTLALVVVVFSVVQFIEGYILTPKIMGDRTGLHPLAIIVAIFFWGTALNGLLGMVLAIPLTAFLVVFWRLAKQKYIREWI